MSQSDIGNVGTPDLVSSAYNPTTQHSVQHLPFPVAFSCETNKNGDYAAGSSLLIQ